MKKRVYGFDVSLSQGHTGVYILLNGKEPDLASVAYVGKTKNLYSRLYKHKNGYCYDIRSTVTDVYFIKAPKEYVTVLEIILIGIFQPYGNEQWYRFWNVWRFLFNEKRYQEINDMLNKYYNWWYISNDIDFLKFFNGLEYVAFHKRYDFENQQYWNMENYIWKSIFNTNSKISKPLKELIELYVKEEN